jgi:hypothetical protein
MTPHSQILSAQHDELDRQLAETVAAARRSDWAAYRARFLALRGELVEHMAYEDEELFPQLEQSGLAPADLAVLREDHAQFRQQLDALNAAAPQHDPEGCIAELERLAEFQRTHHAREQAAVYAHANRLTVAPPAARPRAAAAVPAAMDLRGLQPPEPIVRIFQALERSPHAPVRAILPHEPVPLYGLLRERGFAYTGTPRADGGFEVLIERA